MTGQIVGGVGEFDHSALYSITRIEELRPPLVSGRVGVLRRAWMAVQDRLLRRKVIAYLKQTLSKKSYQTIILGALDALGWLVEPLRAIFPDTKIVIYTHGEEISQACYSARAEERRRRALKAADGIVAVSSFTADLLARKYGVDPERIELVTNGVDLDTYDRLPKENVRPHFGLGHGPLVLAVGRLVPRKGFDVLIEAWPRILAAVPGAQLAIAGTGPLSEALKAAAERPEMNASVHMLGFVKDEMLPSLYASADLFAMPNRTMPDGDTEGFGLVFLEAAAAGTPSVGGKAGGAVDAILDGQTGRSVDGEDVGAVAYAITDLLNDEVTRKRMAEAAHAHALTQGWDSKADQLLKFFKRLRDEG
ncbi:glycosyltransferase family 4 protein [Kordiimonas lacus]|nr:glycosyltransferase family 4 protein [Kordiimonas lacus]